MRPNGKDDTEIAAKRTRLYINCKVTNKIIQKLQANGQQVALLSNQSQIDDYLIFTLVRMVSKGFEPEEFESHGSIWQLHKKKIEKHLIKMNQKQIKTRQQDKHREN